MKIEYLRHPDAPPGSPPVAAAAGDLVFVGGQLAVHPTEGIPAEANLLPHYYWHGSSIHKQLTYIYGNLDEHLKQLGSSLWRCLKINSYHTDSAEVDMALRVRRDWFDTDSAPPSSLPHVPELPVHGATVCLDMTTLRSGASLDREKVEIELVAVDPRGPYRKEVIHTDDAPTPLGGEPQAVRAGPYLFLSTQMATDYRRGLAPDARPDPNFPFHSSAIQLQAAYILKNVESICHAAGTGIQNLVKRRAIHTDLRDHVEADRLWREATGDRLPPTTCSRTESPLVVPGCSVQCDLTAVIPD